MSLRFCKKKSGESGEVMLESTIVFTLTLMILIAMMGLGYALCMQSVTYTVACETAENIADNYKYIYNVDLDDRVIGTDEATSLGKYRNFFGLRKAQRESGLKADAFIEDRISNSMFPVEESMADVELVSDNIGRTHVSVTVTLKSNTLFLGAARYEGFGLSDQFTAGANADCLDLTGYAGHAGTADYLAGKAEDTNLGHAADNLAGMQETIQKTVDLIRDIFS